MLPVHGPELGLCHAWVRVFFFLTKSFTDWSSPGRACEACAAAKRKCAETKEESKKGSGKRKAPEADGEAPKKKTRSVSASAKGRGKTEEPRQETGPEWRRRIERRFDELERRIDEGFRRVMEEMREWGEDEESDEDGEGEAEMEE